jgi:hypothetical protein
MHPQLMNEKPKTSKLGLRQNAAVRYSVYPSKTYTNEEKICLRAPCRGIGRFLLQTLHSTHAEIRLGDPHAPVSFP